MPNRTVLFPQTFPPSGRQIFQGLGWIGPEEQSPSPKEEGLSWEGEETLPQKVVELFLEKKKTFALAESCTGGWVSQMVTDIRGSSQAFYGSWVTYSNGMKIQSLDVEPSVLDLYGAVSPECAGQMAMGALQKGMSDIALSITGIAGPDGGSVQKPVGLVYFGLANSRGSVVFSKKWTGDRNEIRLKSSVFALILLYKGLIELDKSPHLEG